MVIHNIIFFSSQHWKNIHKIKFSIYYNINRIWKYKFEYIFILNVENILSLKIYFNKYFMITEKVK